MMNHNENFDDIYLKYWKFSVKVAMKIVKNKAVAEDISCLLYTSPSPRD